MICSVNLRRARSGFPVFAISMLIYMSVTASGRGAEPNRTEHPFRMPVYAHDVTPPPPRARAEVDRLLANSDVEAVMRERATQAALRVVLVSGPKDHGPGEHDYPAWRDVWSRWLARDPHTRIETADEFPSDETIAKSDVLVFYQRGTWNAERAARIDPYLRRGGGLVYLHWAVDGRGEQAAMAERIGLASLGGQIAFRHGDLSIDFREAGDHPITRNCSQVNWVDESYWRLTGNPQKIHLLGTSREDDANQPQVWAIDHRPGRVFVSIPGHYMWTFDDPIYRTLIVRGIAWVGGRPVDRFNDLIPLDARLE